MSFCQCPQIILNIPQRICAVDRIKELNSRISASGSSTDPFSYIFNNVEYKNPKENIQRFGCFFLLLYKNFDLILDSFNVILLCKNLY